MQWCLPYGKGVGRQTASASDNGRPASSYCDCWLDAARSSGPGQYAYRLRGLTELSAVMSLKTSE